MRSVRIWKSGVAASRIKKKGEKEDTSPSDVRDRGDKED